MSILASKLFPLLGIISLPTVAQAAASEPLFGATTFTGFVENVYNWAIGAGLAVSVIIFIAAGYMLMTSEGDTGKIGFAKEMIVGALSGLILLAGAKLILSLLSIA